MKRPRKSNLGVSLSPVATTKLEPSKHRERELLFTLLVAILKAIAALIELVKSLR